MISSRCRELLVHPVVTGLLAYKWNHFSRYIYYTNLLIFLLYLILLNFYILMLPRFYMIDWHKLSVERLRYSAGFANSTHQPACLYLHNELPPFLKHDLPLQPDGCFTLSESMRNIRLVICAFSACSLLIDILTVVRDSGSWKAQQAVTSLLSIFSILLTINFNSYQLVESFVALPASLDIDTSALDGLQSDTGIRQEWQEKIGAFAIFASWMGLLLVLQNVPLIPHLGVFIAMFMDTLKTFCQFFIILIFFIIGFALSFTVLLGNQALFQRWYESIVAIFVMMIGEMDYSGRFYRAGLGYENRIYTRDASYIMFIIFVTVMTIIIMNLLVGLAVGDIMQVRDNATLQRLALQINSTLDIEFFLPEFLRKKFSCRREVIEKSASERGYFNFGSSSAIFHIIKEYKRSPTDQDSDCEDQIDNVGEFDRVLSSLTSMRTRFEHMLDEQNEAKHKIRVLHKTVCDLREQSELQTKEIRSDLSSRAELLGIKVDTNHEGIVKIDGEVLDNQQRLDANRGCLDLVADDLTEHRSQVDTRFERVEAQVLGVSGDVVRRTEALVHLEHNLQGEIQNKKEEVLSGLEVWREIETRLSREIGHVHAELVSKTKEFERVEERLERTNVELGEMKQHFDKCFGEIKAALAHKFLASDV